MAERVVDQLEAVEIEAQHRTPIATAGVAHHLVEPLAQQRPVGQVRQRVVARQMRDLRGGVASLGDVGNRVEETAIDQPRAFDRDGSPIGPALLDLRSIGRRGAVIFLDQPTMFAGGADRQIRAAAENLVERRPGCGLVEAVYVEEPLVGQNEMTGGVEQREPLVHVVERRLETQVLQRAFRQRHLQFLRHQPVRAIRPAPIDVGFGIGRGDEREQAIDIDATIGQSRPLRLPRCDLMQCRPRRRRRFDRYRKCRKGHVRSPIRVIVIV